MLQAILGKKIRQTRIFTENGTQIPVTQITAGPCTVVGIRSFDKHGYWALQLGFGNRIQKRISQPLAGFYKKTGQGNYLPRFLREVKLGQVADGKNIPYQIGDQVRVDQVFTVGDKVKVTGRSKSKGFQGGVKRHGFKGGPRTHGQSDRERAPGSIGQTTTPGRVYKGKRMAGHMGGNTVTVTGLEVIGIDPEKNLLQIKGLVPGNPDALVNIAKQQS